ncbi:MAG: phage portal protein [Candidatus Coproplasma sp.]
MSYFEASNSTLFSIELDYFELVAVKSSDIIAGKAPTITITKRELTEEELATDEGASYIAQTERSETNLKLIIDDNLFYKKLQEIIIDVSRYGDAVVRTYKDEGENGIHANFTCISPETWFPIVDREIKEKRLYDVIAWTVDITPDKKELTSKHFELHAQIHEAGKYTERVYQAKCQIEQGVLTDGSTAKIERYTIGKLISEKTYNTGFKSCVIRDFHNLTTSSSIFGINDYDRIGPILAELDVRYTLEGLVLDKHTAPSIACDKSAAYQNKDGSWGVNVGGIFLYKEGTVPPQYITWDASLQANHTMIEKLEKHLWSLSEMGAVLNDENFGLSQGYEALETRLSNARLKGQRVATGLESPIKKLISALSEIGYDYISTKELSVQFNTGIPMTESQKADISSKEVGGGALKDVSTVLVERYGKTKREADEIAAKIKDSKQNPYELSFYDHIDDDGGDVTGRNDGSDGKPPIGFGENEE